MEKLKLKAYAKINLHLDVTGIAENGYHKVNTVMQTVSLCDELEISLFDGDTHRISCNNPLVPTDSKNLVWRAADIILDRVGKKIALDIKINKKIPIAAGLAGGSTDAAAVMCGLNTLLSEPLSAEELCLLGAKLGVDVPFCILGGTKFAHRFGDVLEEFPKMPECHMVVACGKEAVSTPWAYSMLDKKFNYFSTDAYSARSFDDLKKALELSKASNVAENLYNIFEAAIEPEREEVRFIKRKMISFGAYNAVMSGSGPSVFGIFPSERDAVMAENELGSLGFDAYYCTPIEGFR